MMIQSLFFTVTLLFFLHPVSVKFQEIPLAEKIHLEDEYIPNIFPGGNKSYLGEASPIRISHTKYIPSPTV